MRCFCLHRILFIFLVFLAALAFCTGPCSAGYKYYSGGPELSVSLAGNDEMIPGTTADLPLVIENKGILTMQFYNVYTLEPQYLPTTAKFARVRLVPGDAPVRVKSDSQNVGDIPSGVVIPVHFVVEVPEDAKAGNYTMQAVISYSYVPQVEQSGTDTLEYSFRNVEVSLPVPIVIRKVVVLSVEDVSVSDLHAGGEGYITFVIRNTGQDTGDRTSIYLVPEGASPIVPFSNGVYVGTLPPGGTVQPRFKVSVSRDADPAQPAPVMLYAVYRDFEGNMVRSPMASAGVSFSEKVRFEVTSPPPVIHAGETNTMSVTYRNAGNSTVYSAQARISVIDPFTSEDDTAYLGDLKPGESATATFAIKTGADATIKTYSLDSDVRYLDASQTSFTSDNIPVVVEVREGGSVLPIAIVLIIVVAGGGAYLWYRKKSAAAK